MSDPGDVTDIHGDNALNKLIRTIEDTGGLTSNCGLGVHALVPKGDTERMWTGLAEAYLDACKAMEVDPLIDGAYGWTTYSKKTEMEIVETNPVASVWRRRCAIVRVRDVSSKDEVDITVVDINGRSSVVGLRRGNRELSTYPFPIDEKAVIDFAVASLKEG